ncbi:MAG: sulfite exporter TauE/SafE family protein [Bacillota bacterium]|jgi:uncharacterized membrane protein YfcA
MIDLRYYLITALLAVSGKIKFSEVSKLMHIMVGLVLGLAAGILSALLGIGGGIILVPGMIYLLTVPIKTAAATSLAVILPTAFMGVYRYYNSGSIDWKLAFFLSIGGVAGAYFGVWLSKIIPVEATRKIFALLMLFMAIKLWRG